jgi:hypothetical protein
MDLFSWLSSPRPHSRPTPEALDAARFLLLSPPVPLVARLPYGVLAANAVSLLPDWAAAELRLPRLALVDHLCVRPLGAAMTAAIRWALVPARGAAITPPG